MISRPTGFGQYPGTCRYKRGAFVYAYTHGMFKFGRLTGVRLSDDRPLCVDWRYNWFTCERLRTGEVIPIPDDIGQGLLKLIDANEDLHCVSEFWSVVNEVVPVWLAAVWRGRPASISELAEWITDGMLILGYNGQGQGLCHDHPKN